MTEIKSALHDLLTSSKPVHEILDRHFTPDYRQRTNGAWSDREGFADHIRHLRNVVQNVEITVIDEFDHGERYADRHTVRVDKRDGSSVLQEVYVFAQRDASGRFRRLEEVTLMLDGNEADRHIGSAR